MRFLAVAFLSLVIVGVPTATIMLTPKTVKRQFQDAALGAEVVKERIAAYFKGTK